MIALLTDFGLSEYVGVMKGVIHCIAPEATITDLCHDTYAEATQNELFLIQGSCDTLEISLKNGNANDIMNVESGQRIKIS